MTDWSSYDNSAGRYDDVWGSRLAFGSAFDCTRAELVGVGTRAV